MQWSVRHRAVSHDCGLTLSPPQRLPLGVPIKISIIEKIESARGTMGRGKRLSSLFPLPIVPRALSFFSPQPPHNTKRPLRRREGLTNSSLSAVLTFHMFFRE